MFFYSVFIGFLIGIFMIIPGVSGGVLAVSFGVYEKIIESIKNILKDFKKSFIYLLPYAIGIIFGLLIFSKIVLYFLNLNYNLTIFLLTGFIIGGIPTIFEKIEINKKSLFFIFISFVISVVSLINFDINSGLNAISNNKIMLLSGFLYSAGKIIPGISGANLLMIFGMYDYFMKLVSNPITILDNFVPNILFIIGFILGVIFFINLIDKLFKLNNSVVYSLILGFMLSNIFYIIPKEFNLIGIGLMLVGFVIANKITKKQKK